MLDRNPMYDTVNGAHSGPFMPDKQSMYKRSSAGERFCEDMPTKHAFRDLVPFTEQQACS